MKKAQLESIGITYNQWINLSEICQQLLLTNESRIYTDRGSYQFYFESSSELLFVRFISQILPTRPTTDRIPEDHIIEYIDTDNTTKYGILTAGGAPDNTVGVYHLVIDINQIAATL